MKKRMIMRLWSLHPMYLDASGLTACWREGLLARHVLLGLTKGYRNHPQLIRFLALNNPVVGIDTYLYYILQEAKRRKYHYDSNKIEYHNPTITIYVTDKQLEYELEHLKKKLFIRSPKFYERLILISEIQPHPIFRTKFGGIASWEIIS